MVNMDLEEHLLALTVLQDALTAQLPTLLTPLYLITQFAVIAQSTLDLLIQLAQPAQEVKYPLEEQLNVRPARVDAWIVMEQYAQIV
jgi:uncharacterized membrane protein